MRSDEPSAARRLHVRLRLAGLCGAVVALACPAAILGRPAVTAAWSTVAAGRSPDLAPAAVVLAAAAAGVLAWAWLAVTVCSVAVECWPAGAVARPSPAASPWGRSWVRAAVLSVAGISVLAAVPAGATDDPSPRAPGAPLAERVTGLPVPALTVVAAPPAPDRRHRHAHHGVRPGDSLWSIAAARLPCAAGDLAVDRGWRRLYAANRDVVGPDPDLLRPGQVLTVPAALTGTVR